MTERNESTDIGRDLRGQDGPEPERVVVRDRRRIDPLTGEVRSPAGAQAPAEGAPAPDAAGPEPEAEVTEPADDKLTELSAQLDERTADLQRVSAEYANYRRRSDRDREAVALAARAQVAGELLTVLDDVARAQQHGDLTGPFKAVADKLVSVLDKVGLSAFGVEGDEFDPAVHEAVQHSSEESTGVTVTVVSMVLRPGYRMGDRVLRPAMVGVTEREQATGEATPEQADDPSPGAEHERD